MEASAVRGRAGCRAGFRELPVRAVPGGLRLREVRGEIVLGHALIRSLVRIRRQQGAANEGGLVAQTSPAHGRTTGWTQAAAVALIGGTGAAGAFADDNGPAPKSSVQLSQGERQLDDTAQDRTEVKADTVSYNEATAAALKAVPGTATSAELDTADRNGSLIWEVDVFGKDHKNHDVTVDAASGKVLNQHVDHDDNDNQDDGDDG
ncbi:PepSY domain-containing protein [Streptomyces sp. NPDC007983]|uniref:PepSY domain-containing protein n=1 Tax=Streptomyces sp. NPDC007983 TaxID=3364800 RepID=UPI0036F05F28